MKYLSIILTKYVQDMCAEDYKILIKVIKEALNKWRDILYLWTERLNFIKM